ncbi:MAG: type III pantothenate kinase [Thermodesulfovibrionales bacterium]|nr:type III pantothenate kinase [Thermodesulfovibrionales bacterium]
MSFIVAVDIGNSTITAGRFSEEGLSVISVPTFPVRDVYYYSSFFREIVLKERPKGFIISSVVPELTLPVKEAALLFTDKVILMDYRLDTGLRFAIPEPEKTGTDRIAEAAAAYDEFKAPLVVADLGTATTLTVIGEEGLYMGGAILPGVRAMAEALGKQTAQLPEIEPSFPAEPVGRETVSAINSGIIYGTAGAVERLREEFEKELGKSLLLITTGGNAPLIEPYLRRLDFKRPYLVLKGLKLIFERNLNA